MMGGNGADATAYLSTLKARLKITPAQEPAWKAYESAVTQQASAMQAAREKFRAEWQNLKPGEVPDRAAHFEAMAALRQSGWEAQGKARADLFAVLTPEQQALAGGGWGHRGGPRR
jgi:Spy/CpxP family protein refolding chaperone